MLNVFPELLFLAPLAALVIRAAVAVAFALATWNRFRTGAFILGGIEALTAAALAFGFYTQIAAIVGFFLVLGWLFRRDLSPYPFSTIVLLGVMCATLLVTGSGPFAFDLPL